jgi:subtilisin family serine protease
MRRILLVTLLVSLGGCASAPSTPAPQPAPPAAAPAPTPQPPAAQPAPPAPAPPAAAVDPAPLGPPDRWFYQTTLTGGVPGAAVDAAHALLAGRQPGRQVVVAIIDGGVDVTHEDLDGVLWANPRETPGNNQDDDRNGYVDDVHGWNFIGGANGQSVNYDTFELTRLQAACTGGAAAGTMPSPGPARCAEIAQAYQAERAEIEGQVEQVDQITQIYPLIVQALTRALGSAPTPEKVAAMRPTDAQTAQAQDIYLQLAAAGLDEQTLAEQGEVIRNLLRYGLDTSFNPRNIVGDDFTQTSERTYGNADVAGPDAGHGTAVASVVAAERSNGLGIEGIASGVRIMSVRTVPNGDERDKDVANAIRYAVDHGANIINMSFGKAYSPQKEAVDAAVKYAEQRGVLMVHAAGNDGEDLATSPSFPTDTYDDGSGSASLWIEVGASNWEAPDQLAASFSNYGAQQVDLFAPGVAIQSAAPGNQYKPEDGTSLAAPVVTGVAALLMAYFPNLDARAVKQILLETATDRKETMVARPGMGTPVRFGDLSVTGGIVNAEAAVRRALQGR